MGIRWNIDHMKKAFFLNEAGEIVEVKNVFDENEKINLKKIKVGSVERKVSEFSDYFDYNTSFDDIQLPVDSKKRDLLMQEVLRKISEIKEIDTSYFSKKKLKNGEIKEYFCLRKQSLAGTFFFYHNNTEDHPHFHICMPKKVYTGKGCLRLRKELNSIFKEYGLIPNCEIVVDANEKNTKKLLEFREVKNKLEKFSWLIKQAETKITNPSETARNYLESKTFKDANNRIIYQGNHTYFSFLMENFVTEKVTEKTNKKIKVYSIPKLISEYKKMQKIAGSDQFVFELCNSIDRIFNFKTVKEDGGFYNFLNRINGFSFEKKLMIDSDSTEKIILKSLANDVIKGSKLNPEYKIFWRNNVNSEDPVSKFVAEGIAKLYSLRKNRVFDFDKEKVKQVYLELKSTLENLFEEKEMTEKIVTFYETLLKKEVVNEANINQALKQEFGLEKVYTKKIEDTQFLILETAELKKMKIELTQTLKKFAENEGINFVTSYQIIKNNQLKNLNLDVNEQNLKNVAEVVLENLVETNKNSFLNDEFDFNKTKADLSEAINLNEDTIIKKLILNFESGLLFLITIFKKIVNFVFCDLIFSQKEKIKLNDLENAIENDYFFEKEFPDEKN